MAVRWVTILEIILCKLLCTNVLMRAKLTMCVCCPLGKNVCCCLILSKCNALTLKLEPNLILGFDSTFIACHALWVRRFMATGESLLVIAYRAFCTHVSSFH